MGLVGWLLDGRRWLGGPADPDRLERVVGPLTCAGMEIAACGATWFSVVGRRSCSVADAYLNAQFVVAREAGRRVSFSGARLGDGGRDETPVDNG